MRHRRRRRLALAGAVAVVAAIVASVLALLHSPLLAARHVAITGAVHESGQAVLLAGGLEGRPPLIDVSPSTAASRIAALPWVAQAVVERHWPDGLSIVITERRATGSVVLGKGRWALLDPTGRVLGDTVQAPTGVLALVDLGSIPPPGGSVGATGVRVAGLAAAIPAPIASYVVDVGSSDTDGLTLTLVGGTRVLVGSPSELSAKLTALATLLADESAATLHAKLVDLRVPGSPVLTPT